MLYREGVRPFQNRSNTAPARSGEGWCKLDALLGLSRTVRLVGNNDEKHPERVLGEYIAADSPGEWLASEVGDYLFGEQDPDEREDGLEQVFERVDAERRNFVSTQLEPSQLVQFSIEVERAGRTMRATFGTIPSPVVLLDACIRIADVGDQVMIEHSYASGDQVTFAGPWPFGMDWAVRATAPMGETLIEESENVEYALLGDGADLDFAELYDQDADEDALDKLGMIARAFTYRARVKLAVALAAGSLAAALAGVEALRRRRH